MESSERTGTAGTARAVVIIPGLMGTRRFFRQIVEELSADHDVFVVELPGHGATPVGDGPATLRRATLGLCREIEERGLHDVTLVGWSLGATVACSCLEQMAPGRVGRLVWVEQTPRLTTAADWPHAVYGNLDDEAARQLRDTQAADPDAFAEALVRGSFAADSRPDERLVRELLAEARSCDPAAVGALLAEAVSQDIRDSVTGIQVPTLLIHGTRSQVYPTPVGNWLAEAIRTSRLLMFEDSGHMPFLEEARRFTAAIREFTAK